jgi:hypothetical protein
MFVDITAQTEIGAQLDSNLCGFEVVVDHIDDEARFKITLNDTSKWISEADFNEIFKVMRKARAVKKAGIKL